MKKWSVWMLAITLVLGIGFSALAEDISVEGDVGLDGLLCPPPPAKCKGNLPLEKTMDVKLHVVPYAKLELNDMDISFCRPGTLLNGQIWVPFKGGANTPINVSIASRGFDPALANNWITYGVAFNLLSLPQTFRPGGTGISVERSPGRWSGRITALGMWWDTFLNDWTDYLAGDYEDQITVTVSASGVS